MDISIHALQIWFECLTYGGLAIVAVLFFVCYLQAHSEARSILTISTPNNPPNSGKAAQAPRSRLRLGDSDYEDC